MAAVGPDGGGGANLEDRLGRISQMLEEAVAMLRNTMVEVREEADEAGREQQKQRPERGKENR